MLKVNAINTFHGPAHVLFDLSLEVREHEVVCVVGRNGVGKTTCLHSILGMARVRSGGINFLGQEISGLQTHKIINMGMGYAPGNRRIFPDLTVRENLELAMRDGGDGKPLRTLDWVRETFPTLVPLEGMLGGQLSGGQQHVLTFARALIGDPRLVLVDEPTEGLSPVAVVHLRSIIEGLKATGLTMLIAAPDMKFAMRIADRIYVMSRGRVVYGGTVADVRRDEEEVRSHFTV